MDVQDGWLGFHLPDRNMQAEGRVWRGFRVAGQPLEQEEVLDECSRDDSSCGLGY